MQVRVARSGLLILLAVVSLDVSLDVSLHAQGRGGRGGAPQPPPTAKAGAPIDFTGYWVSVVTGDWRFRMVTPLKGDYTSMPMNAEARKIADAWDPAKDEAAGEQCKSYGAPALMRVPGRLHITWQDDQTLKLEMDSGTQTRVFSFGAPQSQGGDWQGVSKASWEYLPAAVVDTLAPNRNAPDRRAGSLKLITTNFKPGYLRKNGVPYSANAVLTEYFDRVTEPNGDTYIIVTSTVEDPTFLNQPFMLSTHFKKQADASGWNPTPCSAK
jgi:hypothetical protein